LDPRGRRSADEKRVLFAHGGYRLVGFLLFFVWMILAAIFMLVRPTEEENPFAVPTTT
jgi:hypothetical protein